MNSNCPAQLPISDAKLSFQSANLSLKESEVGDGVIQTWNFLLHKILMMSCHKCAYFLRYVFHCLSQISSCPILGVTVDFPSVLEAGGGLLNPCLKRALALVVELKVWFI